MIINTNPGAAMAARILGESSSALQKSLSRLSSGSKIASPSDDAAGTGVAMKFGAQINRIQAAKDNVGNAIAYAQTQDGFLETVDLFRLLRQISHGGGGNLSVRIF